MPVIVIENNARSTRHSSFVAALDHGQGVLRMAPNWVPRSFCVPGRRIKLHPDDYFALGGARGGIDERWLSSTIRADNGPLTGADEGLSFAVGPDGDRLPFDEVVADLGCGLDRRAALDGLRRLADVRQVLRQRGPLALSRPPFR